MLRWHSPTRRSPSKSLMDYILSCSSSQQHQLQQLLLRRRWVVGILGFASFGGSSACAPQYPEFGEIQYDSEFIEVWASDETLICAGSFGELDHFSVELRTYAEAIQVGWAHEGFRYYWLNENEWEDVEDTCGGARTGCYLPRSRTRAPVVYANELFLHEVVHAMFRPASGGHPLFREGLATLLSASADDSPNVVVNANLEELLRDTASWLPFAEYDTAAFVTRIMIDAHGKRALKMMEHMRLGMSPSEASQVMANYGIDFHEARNAVDRHSPCRVSGIQLNLPECSSPQIGWDDDGKLSFSTTGTCDDTASSGPVGGKVYTTKTFDVPESGSYILSLSSADETYAIVGRCNRAMCESTVLGASAPDMRISGGETIDVDLALGKHWVSIWTRLDSVAADTSARFEVRR